MQRVTNTPSHCSKGFLVLFVIGQFIVTVVVVMKICHWKLCHCWWFGSEALSIPVFYCSRGVSCNSSTLGNLSLLTVIIAVTSSLVHSGNSDTFIPSVDSVDELLPMMFWTICSSISKTSLVEIRLQWYISGHFLLNNCCLFSGYSVIQLLHNFITSFWHYSIWNGMWPNNNSFL